MEPLQPHMFDIPEMIDGIHESYHRTPAGESRDPGHSKVGNWMGRLLRIKEGTADFEQANLNEAELVNSGIHCKVDPKANLTWLYSHVGEPVCYLAGRYTIESVEQLQARNPHAWLQKPNSRTKLIVVTGLRDFSNPNLDVRALQANPRNCGATFQVASNFNGLEYTSASDSRELGVARYVDDRTQGPSAAESCGAAALYRNYFVDGNDYYPGSRNYFYNATEMAKEVNTLDDPRLRNLLPVVNGYVTFTVPPQDEDLALLDSVAHRFVKIVRHDFTQVTYGLKHGIGRTEVMDVCRDHKQIVNQVFNAGINWVDMATHVPDVATRKKFAIFLSKASMIGSLLAAQENRDALAELPSCHGRNRFFPNLVGCGVFENKREWLMDAWRSPEVFPYIQHSGLEIVVCFKEDESAEAITFATQAKQGTITGFLGETMDVEFADAADQEAMAELFGPTVNQSCCENWCC